MGEDRVGVFGNWDSRFGDCFWDFETMIRQTVKPAYFSNS